MNVNLFMNVRQKRRLIQKMVDVGVVGKPSDDQKKELGYSDLVWFNIDRAYGTFGLRNEVIEYMWDMVEGSDPTCILGVGHSGYPLASWLAQQKNGLKLSLITTRSSVSGSEHSAGR